MPSTCNLGDGEVRSELLRSQWQEPFRTGSMDPGWATPSLEGTDGAAGRVPRGRFVQHRPRQGPRRRRLDELIIGRHQAVDITIDDDEMSRRHFELTLVKGQWAIEDLGSLNGTRVNGDVLVGRRVLHAGDEVHAGSTTMGYRDYAEADSSTGKKSPAPSITKGERAVLKELCRPYFSTGRTKAAASRECVAARSSPASPRCSSTWATSTTSSASTARGGEAHPARREGDRRRRHHASRLPERGRRPDLGVRFA